MPGFLKNIFANNVMVTFLILTILFVILFFILAVPPEVRDALLS
jgi:hypothetical protein